MQLLTTEQKILNFGTPNQEGTYLVTIPLPFPMRIAWDLTHSVHSIRCHTKVAAQLTTIFKQLLDAYGLQKIQELGIDIFGGCFAYRKKRGGSVWSSHAFGIAIDLDPIRNGYKTPWTQANFSKPEYAKMIALFEANKFASLGKLRGFDGMHFEATL